MLITKFQLLYCYRLWHTSIDDNLYNNHIVPRFLHVESKEARRTLVISARYLSVARNSVYHSDYITNDFCDVYSIEKLRMMSFSRINW